MQTTSTLESWPSRSSRLFQTRCLLCDRLFPTHQIPILSMQTNLASLGRSSPLPFCLPGLISVHYPSNSALPNSGTWFARGGPRLGGLEQELGQEARISSQQYIPLITYCVCNPKPTMSQVERQRCALCIHTCTQAHTRVHTHTRACTLMSWEAPCSLGSGASPFQGPGKGSNNSGFAVLSSFSQQRPPTA